MDPSETTPRDEALKQLLEARRRAVLASIRQDLHESWETSAWRSSDVLDSSDTAEAMSQDALRFTLLPMKSAQLTRIDDALARLAEGRYGLCRDCRRRISDRRLAAMPFAVRCRRCEERREQSARPERSQELDVPDLI